MGENRATRWPPVYASARYLALGAGKIAEQEHCLSTRGTAPNNGQIFQRSLVNGFHVFEVTGGPSATVVKMKDESGRDRLSFYVAPRRKVRIDDIPDGNYKIFFASGQYWSKNCNRFVPDMQVSRDPRVTSLTGNAEGRYYEFGYTLSGSAGGNFSPSKVDENSF